jgi:adenine-specific DNA-methyltransferase
MILEKEYIKRTTITHRKKFAQFFTPEPVAKVMVSWVMDNPNVKNVLEPAFGLGIFSRLVLKQKKDVTITAFDVDPVIFETAKQNFYIHQNIKYHLEDYLFNDWDNKYDAILCNPPYFKFHDYENKKTLQEIEKRLNIKLSGFTNVYTLFLIKSIYQLKENGRAAYIVPSEFLNADYGKLVKRYLIKSKSLKHIIIFDFKENIFDNAITTSALILLEKNKKNTVTTFTTIKTHNDLNLYPNVPYREYKTENLNHLIKWRIYYTKQNSIKYKNLIPFRNVAKVMRGIATGANDYFIFNESKAKKYKIPKECLLPCITKAKDVTSPFFTNDHLENLIKKDVSIYLLDACKNDADINIQNYVKLGELKEINKRYLTSKRNPWYSLENRPPAPIWVGVFNRKGLKFIRNEANIRNLTTFHCIYPNNSELFYNINVDLLFAYLLTDIAKQIFNDNSREYGDGLKKFEPNDLNNALILDLSKLDKQSKLAILGLYHNYKISILNNEPANIFLDKINEILIKKYKA